MNHLSLFSGIGGLDLAAEWAGFRTVAFVERDPYCQRVLAKRWPGVPCFGDVRDVAHTEHCDERGLCQRREDGGEVLWRASGGPSWERVAAAGSPIRLVSGGFPCQPHSVAGKRQASADDRDLWPEVARVLRAIRPRWFVGENVRGLLHSESGRFFGSILGDLADMGYRVGWGVWGASDVGALHQRERVFIVAHAGHEKTGRRTGPGEAESGRPFGDVAGRSTRAADVADADEPRPQGHRRLHERAAQWPAGESGSPVPDADGRRQQEREELDGDPSQDSADGDSRGGHADRHRGAGGREPESRLGGMAYGLHPWLDEPDIPRVAVGVPERAARLRALGNAVVPQQAFPLFAEIARIERGRLYGEDAVTSQIFETTGDSADPLHRQGTV